MATTTEQKAIESTETQEPGPDPIEMCLEFAAAAPGRDYFGVSFYCVL